MMHVNSVIYLFLNFYSVVMEYSVQIVTFNMDLKKIKLEKLLVLQFP